MVRALGPLIFQAAAKDVRVNKQNAALYGMLDNSFRRPSPDEPRVNLGGDEWANEWPKNSAWDFVAHRFTKDGTWRRQNTCRHVSTGARPHDPNRRKVFR